MSLSLPQPPDEKLERSPLALVVWQVRHDPQPQLATLEAGLRVHELVGGKAGEYPSIDQVQGGTVTFQLGPGAQPSPAQTVQPAGWRLSSPNHGSVLTFATDALTLETSDYGRWQGDFRDQMERGLKALGEAFAPISEQRVGLRYVDRISDLGFSRPSEWAGWLKPWAIGPAGLEGVASETRATEMSSAIEIDDEASARIRIAIFPESPDELVGVIDTDVSREGIRKFDPDDILETGDRFHTASKQLFFAALEDQLYAHLKGGAA